MRVTIFGDSGLLGKALMREWCGDSVTGLSSSDADIRDEKRVDQLVQEQRPDWIILTAAYTDVDGCESNRDLAFAVNRDGAVIVAKAAKAAGARLLFLSSDYVFDGTKTTPYETGDARNPQSVYGRSKAEAEIRLLELLPGNHLFMLPSFKEGFPVTVVESMKAGCIPLISDWNGSTAERDRVTIALPARPRSSAAAFAAATKLSESPSPSASVSSMNHSCSSPSR